MQAVDEKQDIQLLWPSGIVGLSDSIYTSQLAYLYWFNNALVTLAQSLTFIPAHSLQGQYRCLFLFLFIPRILQSCALMYVTPEAFYFQCCPFASLPLLVVHICKEWCYVVEHGTSTNRLTVLVAPHQQMPFLSLISSSIQAQ